MEPAVAVLILAIVLIVAALAIFLIATILELRKIARGLDVVTEGVGELVTKTAPVNGVLDAVNGTLVTGRDVLEGLFLKKAGPYSGGLVESCFPGEGSNFLRRVGRSGPVTHVGDEFEPGAATLAALVAATRGQAAPAAAPAAPAEPVDPGARLDVRGSRPWEGNGAEAAAPPAPAPPAPPEPAPAAPAPPPAPPAAAEPPAGRMDVRGSRPWEAGHAGAAAPLSPPLSSPAPAPAPAAEQAASEEGRLNVRASRPWEGGHRAAPPARPSPSAPAPADDGPPAGRLNVRASRPWEQR